MEIPGKYIYLSGDPGAGYGDTFPDTGSSGRRKFSEIQNLLPRQCVFTVRYSLGCVCDDFKLLFNTDFGLVNHILRTFGLGGVDWLNTVWGARAVVIMGITWRWTGYNTIIMIAGLKGIPMELYESADIDGASFLQRFFRITIPMVKSIILFVSITSTIGTLQLFDESFVLTKGGPDNATITIGHYLYNTGFSYYKFGYAAALSYALVLIIGILSFVQFKATNGGDN